MLEKAGVEVPTEYWTFDDLLQAALKIQATFDDPTKQWAINLPTYSTGVHWIIKSFGGDMVTADPLKAHFDQPGDGRRGSDICTTQSGNTKSCHNPPR